MSTPSPIPLDPAFAAETRQPLFYGITFSLLVLSLIVVSLRFFCRAVLIKKVGLDDWLILVGLIFAWVFGIFNHFHISFGIGKHIELFDFNDLIPFFKYWYSYQLLYPIILLPTKLSILAFYKGISPQKHYQIAVWATVALVVVYTISVFFVYVFECPNPSTAWSLTFPTGCMNLSVLYYATASGNILTDIVILILPIPVLLTVQIQKRKRIALVGIFFIGFIAVFASISRIWAIWLFQNSKDNTWESIFILIFSNIEINVAIITASAPPLRPLFKDFFKSSIYGFTSRSRTGDQLWTGRSRTHGGVPLGSLNGYGDNAQVNNVIRGGKDTHKRNESEEDIIAKKPNGIVQTTEISVAVNSQQSSESLPV
ncbi:hypothetical protein H072_5350 [Dactylellina haptotyla CBS 200.50]|uniref:Rhodopsin domain-containing protein n=1 Tax=Dactylellina haptotyla (strain CBS 200.50) TaxID=1284197 RepID=S8BMQ9_DACHA|nr:hypothetical protein H072_5350 [Dactylellina haptotyla CBS 200.50]